MSGNWVAVASAEHVRIGRSNGFMQVCHGKAAPLRRVQPGDRVVYYSPTFAFRGRDGLQSFTAIGVVDDGTPYQADMGGGFAPFRRDVTWCSAEETPIKPLVGRLHFTTARPNWGFQLRFGLFEISGDDMAVIATAMGAQLSAA
jgi:hypothetical protein